MYKRLLCLLLGLMLCCLPALGEEELEMTNDEITRLLWEMYQTENGDIDYTVLPDDYQTPIEGKSGVYNLLLLGIDNPGSAITGRSDTMLLASLNARTGTLKLISFMRDTYVAIPHHGHNKLNAAYAYGGAELLLETLEASFGVQVDGYVAVNYQLMADLVDAIGGVELTVTKDEMKKRTDEMLSLVHIDEYQDRLPERLSGGQQQRVALARAIVIHPQVLLMDEPLSNLDAKLRIEMRSVIHDIQRQVGITTVYVTHDQEEALAISDRIAVMNKGVIQQIGTPHHIYSRPANVFVATFIGHSNLFHATLSKKDGRTELCFPSGYRLPMTTLSDECTDGQEVVVGIRPEEFSVSSEGLTCDVLNRTFLGRYSNYFLHFTDGMCVPDQPSIEFSQDLGHTQTLYQPGDHLTLRPNPDKINVFTADMEKSLLKDVIRYEQA